MLMLRCEGQVIQASSAHASLMFQANEAVNATSLSSIFRRAGDGGMTAPRSGAVPLPYSAAIPPVAVKLGLAANAARGANARAVARNKVLRIRMVWSTCGEKSRRC